ncbi:hypothetical protein ACGF5M_05950 [Gemmatimonadota bacterium]
MRPNVLLSIFVIVGLAACESTLPPTVMVTDSAGVRITLSPDAPTTYAVVDPQPVLSLGGPNVSGPTQFHRIQHVHIDAHGRVWVADGQSGELRIFDSDGSHWKTRGGRGEGPGEFLRIRLLGSFRGDSVAAWDGGTGRLTIFDGEGEFIRSVRVPSGDDPLVIARDVFGDGTLLSQIGRIIPAGSLEAGQILGDSVRLARIDLESSTQRPQGGALGPLWVWTGRDQISLPFTINASFDIRDESVHLVSGPSFRIRVFEDGGLSELYGVARDVREVSEADIAAYREIAQHYTPESRRNDYLSVLGHPMRPTVLPAYSRLVGTADGYVWAQIYSPDLLAPATWDVFNGDREWVGQVETPGSFMAMTITEGSVAGVWRDDLGVEHVRVYRIRPG